MLHVCCKNNLFTLSSTTILKFHGHPSSSKYTSMEYCLLGYLKFDVCASNPLNVYNMKYAIKRKIFIVFIPWFIFAQNPSHVMCYRVRRKICNSTEEICFCCLCGLSCCSHYFCLFYVAVSIATVTVSTPFIVLHWGNDFSMKKKWVLSYENFEILSA